MVAKLPYTAAGIEATALGSGWLNAVAARGLKP